MMKKEDGSWQVEGISVSIDLVILLRWFWIPRTKVGNEYIISDSRQTLIYSCGNSFTTSSSFPPSLQMIVDDNWRQSILDTKNQGGKRMYNFWFEANLMKEKRRGEEGLIMVRKEKGKIVQIRISSSEYFHEKFLHILNIITSNQINQLTILNQPSPLILQNNNNSIHLNVDSILPNSACRIHFE